MLGKGRSVHNTVITAVYNNEPFAQVFTRNEIPHATPHFRLPGRCVRFHLGLMERETSVLGFSAESTRLVPRPPFLRMVSNQVVRIATVVVDYCFECIAPRERPPRVSEHFWTLRFRFANGYSVRIRQLGMLAARGCLSRKLPPATTPLSLLTTSPRPTDASHVDRRAAATRLIQRPRAL